MNSYFSQVYLCVSECNEFESNGNLTFQFLIPSRYPLHHLNMYKLKWKNKVIVLHIDFKVTVIYMSVMLVRKIPKLSHTNFILSILYQNSGFNFFFNLEINKYINFFFKKTINWFYLRIAVLVLTFYFVTKKKKISQKINQ